VFAPFLNTSNDDREQTSGVRRLLIRHPFTLLGVLTGILWFMVEKHYLPHLAWLPAAIIPMYVMRIAIVTIEVGVFGGVPRWIDGLTLPLLMVPYILLDFGWRRALRALRKRSRQHG
jgi:hypothetical protein